ncbi:unnamed protein product [Arctia plantaginis]|nr:unnamed protein product [Arctia plantaginis]
MNKGMFNTPPRTMIKTRGPLARESLPTTEDKSIVLPRKVRFEIVVPKNDLKEIAKQIPKMEGSLKVELTSAASVHSKKRSTRSSLLARRKRLELEAAEAKAEIEKKLLEKRLEAQLAALEGGSSRKSQCNRRDSLAEASNKVEEWLNKNGSRQQRGQRRYRALCFTP